MCSVAPPASWDPAPQVPGDGPELWALLQGAGLVMRRWEGRIKGWAVASHENHSARECCDSQTQVLPPASTQGSFRMWWVFQAPGNAGDNQQGSGGGLGPRSLLRGGLSGSPVQPWSAGSWHPSSPGRSWGCPLPTGRDTGAQEGGDLRRAP